MLSRRNIGRNYGATTPAMVRQPGQVKAGADGLPYAVQRPTNSPHPSRAPQYLYQYPPTHQQQHNRRAMPGGGVPLNLRAQVGQATNQRSGG